MSWLSVGDLAKVVGFGGPAEILQQAIDDAEAEVTAYLDARGVTAGDNTVCKLAAKKLAKGYMLEYWMQDGRNQNHTGNSDESIDSRAGYQTEIRNLRADAFALLNDYLMTQTSLDSPRLTYVVKVN